MQTPPSHKPRVGLFVTCLVDLFRPGVGEASARLLEDAGYAVDVPLVQRCCGRTAFNADDRDDMRDHATSVIEAYEAYDHVVVPSSSCASLIREHYPTLLADDPVWGPRADTLSRKVRELVSFLIEFAQVAPTGPLRAVSITYHDCHSRPTLPDMRDQPIELLESIPGVGIKHISSAEPCCGSRGAASRSAIQEIRAAGAGMLVGPDLGCLMGLAGELRRDGSAIEVRHVAELLAGLVDTPPIGAAKARHTA